MSVFETILKFDEILGEKYDILTQNRHFYGQKKAKKEKKESEKSTKKQKKRPALKTNASE